MEPLQLPCFTTMAMLNISPRFEGKVSHQQWHGNWAKRRMGISQIKERESCRQRHSKPASGKIHVPEPKRSQPGGKREWSASVCACILEQVSACWGWGQIRDITRPSLEGPEGFRPLLDFPGTWRVDWPVASLKAGRGARLSDKMTGGNRI